jgi:hypothetical protein
MIILQVRTSLEDSKYTRLQHDGESCATFTLIGFIYFQSSGFANVIWPYLLDPLRISNIRVRLQKF